MLFRSNPIRFSGTPIKRYEAPPLAGADTDAILSTMLGLSSEKISDLKARKIT